jgi:hypothetical protein
MEVAKDNLYLCAGCLGPAVNGDFSCLDNYYDDAAGLAQEKASILAGLAKLGPHLVTNHDSETGEGVLSFSALPCNCCGTTAAGERYRFATLAEGDTCGYGLVDSLGSKRRKGE